MSDTDRLLFTVLRQQLGRPTVNPCTCGTSRLDCRTSRYLNGNDAYCCPDCDHTEGTP